MAAQGWRLDLFDQRVARGRWRAALQVLEPGDLVRMSGTDAARLAAELLAWRREGGAPQVHLTARGRGLWLVTRAATRRAA